MSTHTAQVAWQLGAGEDFTAGRYSRRHRLLFDGGAELAGSSSPSVVRLPWSDAAAVDPEELFVASLASCHMLWFLSLAAEQGFTVVRYADEAVGEMARDAQGRLAMARVTLRPRVQFAADDEPGRPPDHTQLLALHHAAHEACFIANSVRCEVLCEPQA